MFPCLLPSHKMVSMWKGLSCLESSLETYSLLWVRSTSWAETMQNIYAGSRVASEWELCPEHQITEDWQWTLWLPLTVLVLGVENWAAVTISGSELFLLSRWGRPESDGMGSDPLLFVVSQPDRKSKYERIQSFCFHLLYVISTKLLLSTCRREEDVWIEQKCPYFWSKQPTINVLNYSWVTDTII